MRFDASFPVCRHPSGFWEIFKHPRRNLWMLFLFVLPLLSACLVDFSPGEIPSVFGEPVQGVQLSPLPGQGESQQPLWPQPGRETALPGAGTPLPGAGIALPGAGIALPGAGTPLPGAGTALPGREMPPGSTPEGLAGSEELTDPGAVPQPAAAFLSPEASAVPCLPAGNPGGLTFQQLTGETFLFTIPEGFNSCANIAMMFGISLERFYTANPETNRGGRCYFHTGQAVRIPPIEILEPGEYVGLYSCVPPAERVCLQPEDPPVLMVAHTLYGEGGSSYGPGSSANILQTALNRIHSLERARGFDAAAFTDGEYERLLIHILAQSYGAGRPQAAYNAFAFPGDRPEPGASSQSWESTLEIAEQVLEMHGAGEWWPDGFAPAAPIRDPRNAVTSYCSCPSGSPPFDPGIRNQVVAFEEKNRYSGRSQWYYRYGQHYCSPSCVQSGGNGE